MTSSAILDFVGKSSLPRHDESCSNPIPSNSTTKIGQTVFNGCGALGADNKYQTEHDEIVLDTDSASSSIVGGPLHPGVQTALLVMWQQVSQRNATWK